MPIASNDDNEDIIKAYEHILRIDDKDARDALTVVVQKLRVRASKLERVQKAWDASSERLRQACQIITNDRG